MRSSKQVDDLVLGTELVLTDNKLAAAAAAAAATSSSPSLELGAELWRRLSVWAAGDRERFLTSSLAPVEMYEKQGYE